MKQVLVVIVNGDTVAVYPFNSEDISKIGVIRERVSIRIKSFYTSAYDNVPNIKLQVMSVNELKCVPFDYISSLVNDIMNNVTDI